MNNFVHCLPNFIYLQKKLLCNEIWDFHGDDVHGSLWVVMPCGFYMATNVWEEYTVAKHRTSIGVQNYLHWNFVVRGHQKTDPPYDLREWTRPHFPRSPTCWRPPKNIRSVTAIRSELLGSIKAPFTVNSVIGLYKQVIPSGYLCAFISLNG